MNCLYRLNYIADLEAVLMASKSVSDKRNGWKQRRRSKSVIIDDPMTYKDDSKDTSHKTLSKWRKVKAAFKWFVNDLIKS